MPYVYNQGVRIYYEVEGAGPPLLLAHGLGDSLETWREFGFSERLADDNRLILVDLRGHGRSDKPQEVEAYAAGLLAGDLVTVLDDLGIDQAPFMGHSSGAQLAFSFGPAGLLSRFPKLILGGANPYWLAGQTDPQVARTQAALMAALGDSAEAMAAFFDAAGMQALPPAERKRLLANDHLALRAYLTALTANEAAPIPVEEYLSPLTVPCLLYAGEADFNYEGARRAAEVLPNATFVSLPGLNHFQIYDYPDVVVPIVKRFLATGR